MAKRLTPRRATAMIKLEINGYTFSAPNIERTLYDGIYVADEEYNLKNLAVTDGFDDEY